MRKGMIRSGIVRSGIIRSGIIRSGIIRNGIIRNGIVRNGIIRNGIVRNGNNRNRIGFTTIIKRVRLWSRHRMMAASNNFGDQALTGFEPVHIGNTDTCRSWRGATASAVAKCFKHSPVLTIAVVLASAPALISTPTFADASIWESHSRAAKIQIGRFLFFDKILSGNKDISCATCHHPTTGSSDGLSLPLGTGGKGLSVSRTATLAGRVKERVPRNSPSLFNLGQTEFTTLFHDGRLQVDATERSGFRSPVGDSLPLGLDNIVAAQAMLPVQSAVEMAGQPGQNPVADAAAQGDLFGPDGVWPLLTRRVAAIPAYAKLFIKAYDNVSTAADISYVHIANSIAAFEIEAFRAMDSPFDRYLRGQRSALSENAKHGGALFYGRAGCSRCHAGRLQTDHQFHSIGIPPIGPGKGDGPSGNDDFGRERVSGDRADRYRFRTPSLRNVALTGPWGHSGAYNSLEAMLRHHLQPQLELMKYATEQTVLPRLDAAIDDFAVLRDAQAMSDIVNSIETDKVALSSEQQSLLIDFLHALTDRSSIDLRRLVPQTVPSGLPVSD